MKVLLIFIFMINIFLLIYNLILIKNASKDRNKYKEIIKIQRIENDFLKSELEEIEDEEIFGEEG